MKASYKVICEKLGFDPLANPPKSDGDDWIINDNEENIYGVLDSDEIDLLIEIGIATQNIRKAAGLFY